MGFEVSYDPGQNIKIVQTVQKYPVVYNYKKYPPVEYRGVADQAWSLIAAELGVSEGYCKGRWTNIRGCFKRYLRNKAESRSTKDYYLAEYLDFMRPFIKVEKKHSWKRPTDPYTRDVTLPDISTCTEPKPEVGINQEFELKLVDSDGEEESFYISTADASQELDIPEPDPEKDADWSFFCSLLPDVRKMDAEQKTKFRNSLLTSIDMVLYGEDF